MAAFPDECELTRYLFTSRDNQSITKPSSKFSLETSGHSHTLIIRGACATDLGSYECRAENVRASTELELTGGDEPITIDDSKVDSRERIATKGQDVTFEVPFVKEALQTPKAEWSFEGKTVKQSDKVRKALKEKHIS